MLFLKKMWAALKRHPESTPFFLPFLASQLLFAGCVILGFTENALWANSRWFIRESSSDMLGYIILITFVCTLFGWGLYLLYAKKQGVFNGMVIFYPMLMGVAIFILLWASIICIWFTRKIFGV